MAMITADPKDVPHVEHFAFTPEYLAQAKALMANANAANKPPTAPPTTSMAQPISVVNNMGTMWSRPGNGRRPKNSA